MTIVESRVRKGELTLGADPGTSFACQASNVHVTPSYDDDGDRTETLCGDVIPPAKRENWVIGGTSVQDFDDPEGFLSYCWDNRRLTVPFSWQPNTEGAPTWTGEALIVALEEGGDVNSRLTTDWEFELSGEVARTYAAAVAATGATAGTPGTFTPSGATPPANVAGMTGLTASPATAWTSGQYVQTGTAGTAGQAHWSSSAWVAGAAP
jgi:hypothetical protein